MIFALIFLAAIPPPASAPGSCVAGGCHATVIAHTYLHGPVGISECRVCHAPQPGPKHAFQTEKDERKLCQHCHEDLELEKNRHSPVENGKCLSCHDVHGSEHRALLRFTSELKLCTQCHKEIGTLPIRHRPIQNGDCKGCHYAHSSPNEHLLRKPGVQLCATCHGWALKTQHPVGKEECKACHFPHDSSFKHLLKKDVAALCVGCHPTIETPMKDPKFAHAVWLKEGKCTECHDPHMASKSKPLRNKEADLCWTCHTQMKEITKVATFLHGDLKTGKCSSCHVSHGSGFPHLLKGFYAKEDYLAYDPKAYEACFQCHDLATTRFRNGDKNLHFIHTKNPERGRACRLCHDPHASTQPALIRSEMLFGGWKVKLTFEKSKNGGSCVTACHKPYPYER